MFLISSYPFLSLVEEVLQGVAAGIDLFDSTYVAKCKVPVNYLIILLKFSFYFEEALYSL